jgi:cobalt-zinc-cadmium efflux system protein
MAHPHPHRHGGHGPGHAHEGHAHHGHPHHGHGHHGHTHHHPGAGGFGRAFAIGIALNLGFVLAEAGYGIAANSLALIADAGHNLSDVLALAAAWAAAMAGKRLPTARYTYGFRSTTILVALGNSIMLLVVTGGIAWEALNRLAQPEPVAAITVMAVAAIGVAVNGSTALMLASGQDDLNIRGAFLHMTADAAISAGVVAAGGLILWTGWAWIDPAMGLMVSAIIVFGTWSLLRESVDLALGAVPKRIDAGLVRTYLAELPGVLEVHDLHIWAMSTTEVALTAHLVRPVGAQGGDDGLLAEIAAVLDERFGIGHATLQIERGEAGYACALAPAHVV